MTFQNQEDILGYLRDQLTKESALYTKATNTSHINSLVQRWGIDESFSEKHRYNLIESLLGKPIKNAKILDMASGCGSFVIQGLKHGFDVEGVEPEKWKLELIQAKCDVNGYEPSWSNKIKEGVGENLPFEDEWFDVCDSWQTFEHVMSVERCIEEWYRVLKPGGIGIVRAPSYSTFFEGHYKIFWLPMMHGKLATWYLKMRKRPIEGLTTFHPVNSRIIIKHAKQAGFQVFNIKRKQIYDGAKNRFPILKNPLGYVLLPIIYLAWDFVQGVKKFGRSEATISLALMKKK